MKYDPLDSVFSKESIKGVDFYKMHGVLNYSGLEIHQVYYSTVIKGFSFSIITTYINDDQRNALSKTMSTMSFDYKNIIHPTSN